jgi:hypothetical protein
MIAALVPVPVQIGDADRFRNVNNETFYKIYLYNLEIFFSSLGMRIASSR